MQNIVLTGMMGSGKTSVAKALSVFFPTFNLVELDIEIEKKEQKTISQIFLENGESYFREQETFLLKEIVKKNNQIISLGGGAFINETNRNLLKNDFTIYLSADETTIYNRIKNDTSRPLLQNNNQQTKIKELLTIREKFYKQANYQIKTDNKTIEQIVQEIMEKYEQNRCKN